MVCALWKKYYDWLLCQTQLLSGVPFEALPRYAEWVLLVISMKLRYCWSSLRTSTYPSERFLTLGRLEEKYCAGLNENVQLVQPGAVPLEVKSREHVPASAK